MTSLVTNSNGDPAGTTHERAVPAADRLLFKAINVGPAVGSAEDRAAKVFKFSAKQTHKCSGIINLQAQRLRSKPTDES